MPKDGVRLSDLAWPYRYAARALVALFALLGFVVAAVLGAAAALAMWPAVALLFR